MQAKTLDAWLSRNKHWEAATPVMRSEFAILMAKVSINKHEVYQYFYAFRTGWEAAINHATNRLKYLSDKFDNRRI